MNRFSLTEVVALLDDTDNRYSVAETEQEECATEALNSELFEYQVGSNLLELPSTHNDQPEESVTVIISEDIPDNNDKCIILNSYDIRDNNNNVPTSPESVHLENLEETNDDTTKHKTRKRSRNPEEWKQNIRKRRRQSGLDYVSSRGKKMRKREISSKKDCVGKCKFKCAQMISQGDREKIFAEFWDLTDLQKQTFHANTTDKHTKERHRAKSEESRRKSSLKYFLVKGVDRIRVCKEFYLTTLDISSKRVEYFYKKLESSDGIEDMRGKTPKPQKIPELDRSYIREHIRSFPKVPSHYCRSTTTAEYLEPNLSVNEMYRLYKEKCENDNVKPQSVHFTERFLTMNST